MPTMDDDKIGGMSSGQQSGMPMDNMDEMSGMSMEGIKNMSMMGLAHDGVGLAAADFHQDPIARSAVGSFLSQGPRDAFIAILVDVFHACLVGSAWLELLRISQSFRRTQFILEYAHLFQ